MNLDIPRLYRGAKPDSIVMMNVAILHIYMFLCCGVHSFPLKSRSIVSVSIYFSNKLNIYINNGPVYDKEKWNWKVVKNNKYVNVLHKNYSLAIKGLNKFTGLKNLNLWWPICNFNLVKIYYVTKFSFGVGSIHLHYFMNEIHGGYVLFFNIDNILFVFLFRLKTISLSRRK